MKNPLTHITLRNFCLSALLLWSASLDAASVWADFFPAKMMDKNGNEVNRDTVLGNKIVGIYFSASWCGPCRTFSPKLVDFRNKNSNEFEVVYASADNSKSAQLSYMKDKKMDFPSVECKTNAAQSLYNKFGISGIPSLVIISPSDGSTISTNGRSEVTDNPNGCLAKWKKSVVVKEGPTITSFTGGGTIFKGDSASLTWNVSGATSVQISPGHSDLALNEGNIEVTPTSSRTYTLIAINESGSATSKVEVIVFPKPPEDSWTLLESLPEKTEDLLGFGSAWSYFNPTDGIDPIQADPDFYTTWMSASGYDGPGFKQSGKAILGYGAITKSPGIVTDIGLPASGKRYTSYFKRQFTVSKDSTAGLEILSDDGAVVYLDGKEIVRTANFTAPDSYHGLASSNGSETAVAAYGSGSLSAGVHALAISVHNASKTSSDIGFDLRLFTIVGSGGGGDSEFTAWAETNGLSNQPAKDQAMDADPDNDGHSNLLEYALGGNPLSEQAESLQETSADSSKASVTFIRVKKTIDSALSYNVQICPDLKSSWKDGAVRVEGAADGVNQTGLPDGKVGLASRFERVRATFVQDPSTPLEKAFLRIVVTRE
ncbi:MAG: redoxin family protein [Opitutae bacterium]|nr:redoxin family protein [Opitutae bacterium]